MKSWLASEQNCRQSAPKYDIYSNNKHLTRQALKPELLSCKILSRPGQKNKTRFIIFANPLISYILIFKR